MVVVAPGTGIRRSRLDVLLDLALPAACAGCGAEGSALCTRCGFVLGTRVKLPPGTPLGLPATLPMPLAQLEWCAPFTGAVRVALHRLKYNGETRAVGTLAAAMAARWRVTAAGGDLLVPVPVHADRARKRGYDQAFLLAAALSELLGMQWRPLLERQRNTAPQFDLGRAARRSNVTGAFAIRQCGSGRRQDSSAWSCRGSWPILDDDVVTTGSTLAVCAETLLEAGAVAVSAITVARER